VLHQYQMAGPSGSPKRAGREHGRDNLVGQIVLLLRPAPFQRLNLPAVVGGVGSFVSVSVMKVKGCGKRGVELTFYRVRGMLVSRRRVPPLTCGERAESRAGRGVLLCPDCADLHGLKPGKPETDGNVLR